MKSTARYTILAPLSQELVETDWWALIVDFYSASKIVKKASLMHPYIETNQLIGRAN